MKFLIAGKKLTAEIAGQGQQHESGGDGDRIIYFGRADLGAHIEEAGPIDVLEQEGKCGAGHGSDSTS